MRVEGVHGEGLFPWQAGRGRRHTAQRDGATAYRPWLAPAPAIAVNAQWASLAANQRHGLRRSQADKERAIKRALTMKGEECSNREIARHVGTTHPTVQGYREELESSGKINQMDEREVTRDGTTYTQDTSNIGGTSSEGPDAGGQDTPMD